MKAYIQHHFTSGFGDFYVDVYEYLNLAIFLKNIGYDVHLLFKPPPKANDIKNLYLQIFDSSILNFFDSFTELSTPITEKVYNNVFRFFDEHKYFHENHTYRISDVIECKPGLHHWDLFVDDDSFAKYMEPNKLTYDRFRSSADKIINNRELIGQGTRPPISEQIIKKKISFLKDKPSDFDFFHLRFAREDSEISKDYYLFDQLSKIISNFKRPIFLGSSSKYVSDYFKNYDNIFIYEQKENIFDNGFNTLAEMFSIQESKNIYAFNEFCWTSNFLFYAFLENESIQKYEVKINYEN